MQTVAVCRSAWLTHLRMLALLLLGLPGMALACEKSLRWDNDPPFSMASADGTVHGIDIDLNREVLRRLGCTTHLRKLPWARALKELELGRLDILPGAFRKPERERYAYFSGALLPPSRNILFMRREAHQRWPVRSLLELRHSELRLGAQIGVAYGEDYQQLMRDPQFAERVSFNTQRLNLWRMIELGRIDGLIADEHSGRYELRQLGLDKLIEPTEVVVSSEAAEVAFSKKSTQPDFVQRYAKALGEVVADGSYAQIVRRYIGD